MDAALGCRDGERALGVVCELLVFAASIDPRLPCYFPFYLECWPSLRRLATTLGCSLPQTLFIRCPGCRTLKGHP